jgi:dynein heavy chain
MPDFAKEKLFSVSQAAGNLASWIRACVETYEALLVVEPKRKSLALAMEQLKEAETALATK